MPSYLRSPYHWYPGPDSCLFDHALSCTLGQFEVVDMEVLRVSCASSSLRVLVPRSHERSIAYICAELDLRMSRVATGICLHTRGTSLEAPGYKTHLFFSLFFSLATACLDENKLSFAMTLHFDLSIQLACLRRHSLRLRSAIGVLQYTFPPNWSGLPFCSLFSSPG